MIRLWSGLKLSMTITLIVGLSFSCALFAILLYTQVKGQPSALIMARSLDPELPDSAAEAPPVTSDAGSTDQPSGPKPSVLPAAASLDAPAIRQNPELPAGCEITSLTMLLRYAGYEKDKLELAGEMPLDPTPVRYDDNGNISYWGDPNQGFVGDITKRQPGFGIYHSGLYPLLKKYAAGALDLSGSSFERLEKQVAGGVPVVVWTTINYHKPARWVEWDSPTGKVKATFSEHAVLLVGYDADSVYVNDPLSGLKKVKIPKPQFLATWQAMGKQALSYSTEPY